MSAPTGAGTTVAGAAAARRSRTRGVLRVVGDVLLVGTFLVLAAVSWLDQADPSPLGAVVAVVSYVALFWRRRAPRAVLATTAVLAVAGSLLTDEGLLLVPVAVAVLAAVAAGRRALGALVAGALAVVLDGLLLARGLGWTDALVVAVPFVLALAVAVGLVLDSRRTTIGALRDRARRAEETRDAEARRAVAEERVRIARELHDVLAHHVAVVGVQAGVAEHLVTADPPAAREALGHVRTAATTALRELATLLDLLREPDEDRTAPAPTLARLDVLLDQVRATGLRVDATVEGDARDLPPVVDMAAYRVVQEALTNAHKHGAGAADLVVGYRPAAVEVVVRNALRVRPGPSVESAGYGLVGMRERVDAVGGTLTTGASGGTWTVRATLPATTTADPGSPS